MNNQLSKGLIFVSGTIVGTIGSWIILKQKYENVIADKNEEIMFLRDHYSKKDMNDEILKCGETIVQGISDGLKKADTSKIDRVKDIAQKLGYTNIEGREEDKTMSNIEIILVEEVWEQDYPVVTLTYYEGDNTITNEQNKIIKNAAELIGTEFANHFGEGETDTVYVKNNDLEICYEIIRDYCSYSEVYDDTDRN